MNQIGPKTKSHFPLTTQGCTVWWQRLPKWPKWVFLLPLRLVGAVVRRWFTISAFSFWPEQRVESVTVAPTLASRRDAKQKPRRKYHQSNKLSRLHPLCHGDPLCMWVWAGLSGVEMNLSVIVRASVNSAGWWAMCWALSTPEGVKGQRRHQEETGWINNKNTASFSHSFRIIILI